MIKKTEVWLKFMMKERWNQWSLLLIWLQKHSKWGF